MKIHLLGRKIQVHSQKSREVVQLYPTYVTLRKQKLKPIFKTLAGIRFVALFSNMMDIIIALD